MTVHRSRALKRRLRNAGLVAAAVLIASSALSSGALCLGDDGHVAFEITLAGKCLDDVSGRSIAGAAQGLSARDSRSDCGPCTDLGTSSGAWLASTVPDLPDTGPAVALLPHAAFLTSSARPSWRFATGSPSGAQLDTFASTVLRC